MGESGRSVLNSLQMNIVFPMLEFTWTFHFNFPQRLCLDTL